MTYGELETVPPSRRRCTIDMVVNASRSSSSLTVPMELRVVGCRVAIEP